MPGDEAARLALESLKKDLKETNDRIQISETLVRAMAVIVDRAQRHEFMIGYLLNERARIATMRIITDSLVATLKQLR